MKKVNCKRILGICLSMVILLSCLSMGLAPAQAYALTEESTVDLLAVSQANDWFHNPAEDSTPGTWNIGTDGISVDAFGMAYAMGGATYLTRKGTALGAYSVESSFVINELNNVENPMIGIIPWYVDEDNYLFVQLKFTWTDSYQTTAEEKADGYALQEIIVSGKLNGEAKYNSATAQQENTVFDVNTVTSLAGAKRNPLNAAGHTIQVDVENSGSSGNFMKFTVYYNGVSIGSVSGYYYNKIAKTTAMGFMAQDVRATFTEAKLTEGYAENKTAALARDWKQAGEYTYRVLNGVDPLTFHADGSISFQTTKTENKKSEYTVTGSNFGGYNTARVFQVNPYAATADGLPQNYEVSATFKADAIQDYTTNREYKLGYGLLAWYKDDQNFVSATIRRTEKGKVGFSTVKYEVVLYGWIDCSNLGVGTTVYTLPDDFDPLAEHTLRVEKKSVGFFVYLDDGEKPIISKRIAGTSENYYYGYEGYNVEFTASAIESKTIYTAYDEISSYDQDGNVWKNAGKDKNAWSFGNGTISVSAKESSAALTARSYLLGISDVSDINLTLELVANISLGSDQQYSELMLAPYILDEHNFVRAGLAWKDGKVYARVYACTYTEEDEVDGKEPAYTLKECEIAAVDLSKDVKLTVKKIGITVGIFVNDQLVYGEKIADINSVTEDYGLYVYNMDLTVDSYNTVGYKKYTQSMVGDWLTSGIKNNQWTINSDGWLLGDATYTDDIEIEDKDDDKTWALVENPNGDYTLTVTMRVTAESRAEDRVGLVVWYLDEENYIFFYMDKWRSDSTVPRTTLTGLINGEYLPTRYNHGGWFPEGEEPQEDGMTITEKSQLDQWHTITVVKSGNTFTCSVDGTMGKLTYSVAGGLPSTTGKTVYSGIYAQNDAIEVKEWAITPAGEEVKLSTPALPSQKTDGVVETLELGTYSAVEYVDAFDGNASSGENPPATNPPTTNPPETNPPATNPPATNPPDDNNGDEKKGCFGTISGGAAALGLLAAAAVVLKKKNQKEN